jgi:hypothetical protein
MTTVRVLGLILAMVSGSSALAATDKYHITPEEHAACDADAKRLCMASYPSEDDMLACMQLNRAQLTAVCLVVFDAGIKRRHIKVGTSTARD